MGPKLDEYCEERMENEERSVVGSSTKLFCACCQTPLFFDLADGYHVKHKKRWCDKCYAKSHHETTPQICPNLPAIKKIQALLDATELTQSEGDAICAYVRQRVRVKPAES